MAQLTERQRDVLKLMASGRTNPEIAEELGVSLSGAKWHVSEVISRLGVQTREEATEVWREEHSLPRRFSNAFHMVFGMGTLKVGFATVTVTSVGVLGIASIVIVRDMRAEDDLEAASALEPLTTGYEANQQRLNETLARVESPATEPEDRLAIYSQAEAREIGRQLAASVIHDDSQLGTLSFNGHAFTEADLVPVEGNFYEDAAYEDLGLPGAAAEFPTGKNLWTEAFSASGFDFPDGPNDIRITVMFEDGKAELLDSWRSSANPLPTPPGVHPTP